MNDKKILFPLLLFAIFFVLIAFTGFFQVTITKRNIEGLLQSGGETLFKSIAREIEMNMEYLTLVERSPSIITPNFLNVLAYDDAIVDDLYSQFTKSAHADRTIVPLENILVVDRNGKRIEQKGEVKVDRAYFDLLLRKDQRTVIRMPSNEDRSLFMGIKLPDRLIFLTLGQAELEGLRKLYVLKTIIENEEKRQDIAEINIYDGSGAIYLGSPVAPKGVFAIRKPLNSRYFPDYSMEILVSNGLATDTFRRTSFAFVMLLFFLMLGGAGGIYIIFRLETKHAVSLKAMEKDMAMKERLVSLGRLASGMAHEIRNPLNAMGMSVQRLKREFVPEQGKKEEYDGFLDIVRSELLRVNRIVEEFLLSTKSGMAMEQQSLRGIIDEVVLMLKEKAETLGIVMANESDRNTVLACQKERMKQVFYNLLTNAIEAIGSKGSIHIRSETESNKTRVVIKDTGPGIKKEDITRIFEYYYTTKDRGMGLGLPISYMIVKDHGGDMQVLSEEGKGTTFVITLPSGKG